MSDKHIQLMVYAFLFGVGAITLGLGCVAVGGSYYGTNEAHVVGGLMMAAFGLAFAIQQWIIWIDPTKKQ